ncbi:DUF427 domain-containing protein [Oricola cellulosilytica]|uniref:DUF427 domain-containing protein n=2 Tax=Oricola cellulosilytica TaxID=1429082 RepID=A0A4R0PB71_9HYPH|nr:DUF427 domain-containing protein [Oricola cellulosilytica]TCD14500.1 DUF427 domain-containing protein [Oricola cellulosilytica]
MERKTIHNPDNEAHFMRIKPIAGTVRVTRGGRLLAESGDALRVMETGRDVYDPVIYFPRADVSGQLVPVEAKSTHCPLKGDASYFSLEGEEIAWSYDRPLEVARELGGYVAFYSSKVVIAEAGADAA